MRKLINDLRYGLRQLAKHPLYSPIAVVTLALGIGANAAIFTVINATLFKPLPYGDEQRGASEGLNSVLLSHGGWQKHFGGVALFLTGGLPRQTFSRTVIKSAQLREDFAVMKKALTSLHPGLYRHVDAKAMERHFDELEQELRRDLTTAEAYLAFSKFLARIKCGHTYANFWNQTDGVKQEVFGQADKVPFTFRLIDKRIYMLVNAANSSATFYLASLMKNNQLATLVGQETGGNRRGLNGGQMFFLRLPNSQIEIDLPLIGWFPLKPQPDQGILPDVQVKPSVENVVKGIDAELEAVKQLIATQLKS